MTSRPPVHAVFGGTFDPPHLGHVAIPPYLVSRGLADWVWVVPVFRHTWHKPARSFAVRHAWTKMAFRPLSSLCGVLDVEAELAARGGRGTSWELLEALAARLPGVRLRLVVGSDLATAEARARYHRWDDIEARFDPIVVPRSGEGETGPIPGISSTRIRHALARGDFETVARWVPRPVYDHLRRSRHDWILLVGRGHVGTHVEPWLVERGFGVKVLRARAWGDYGTVARTAARHPPAGVYVTVADRALPEVARRLAEAFEAAGVSRQVPVLHAAGALRARSDGALGAVAERGHPVGTLHPICSLRRERPWGDEVAGASFGVEGDPKARSLAESLVPAERRVDLDGLDDRARRAYHAACALVANHLAVLRADAVAAAAPSIQGRLACAMTPLLRSSVANLAALGRAGVTGPLVRGDRDAVTAHLAALDGPARDLYRMLSDRLAALLEDPQAASRLPTDLACTTEDTHAHHP